MMGQEKSENRIVPEGRRKAAPTSGRRGGKAIPANEQAVQLVLFSETADNPKGNVAMVATGQPVPAGRTVPKSETTKRSGPSAMSLEEVADGTNLRTAFEQVARNRGAPGSDGQTISWVRKHLNEIVRTIRLELLEETYRPGRIRRVWIPKPGGGQRGLGIPDVVDRMVGQAINQVLTPHFDRTFHRSSHGFRRYRSCHTAVTEAKEHLEAGHGWAVDIDLEKFFDRVPRERLLARVGGKVEDQRVLRLIRRLLKSKVVMPDGVVIATELGVPQGGPLSPLLSNIVLDELDWELDRRGHRFVRYADDCKIYVRSERSGQRVMASVTRYLETRLCLQVNREKSAVAPSGERHFLGFHLRLAPDGVVEIELSKRSRLRIRQRIRDLTPRSWGQSLAACIRRINQYTTGWLGFFRIVGASDARFLRHQDAHIRRRLRAIILKHWRRKRTIVRRLIRLGVRPSTARRRVYIGNRSWWSLSMDTTVHYGLSNSYFQNEGLLSIYNRWQAYRRDTAPKQLLLRMG